MKRLIIYLIILLGAQPLGLLAQTYVEITDSTSTEWTDDGNSGELTPATPSGPVKSLVLSQTTITISGGQSVRLVATVNKDAANKNIIWASSNPTVATVSENGVVWAFSVGTTVITATSVANTNICESCAVTVTSNYVHKGDVNGDGNVTAQDASLILQLVANKISSEMDGIVYKAADVNGDNSVTAQDASLILQYVAGKIHW